MKFHLPKKLLVAVLAAVAATQVYAQTEQVTFDNSKEGVANVTVNGGDLSGYYMYGTYQNKPCAVGTIGAASVWDQDGNAPMEKFSSAIVTMNGGTGLQYLSGYGVGGNAFEGDVTVNMNGGDTEYIVGGTYYASSVNRDRDVLGTNPEYNHESFGYKANYGQESDPDTVDGVKTGSIQNLRGEIGVGASYVVWCAAPAVSDGKMGLAQPCCKKLVLHGEIRYMNDMVRSNPVIEMEGLRGNGENPGRQGVGIEAGATYRISDCWSASANYSVNTMEDSREHRVNVGASYTF